MRISVYFADGATMNDGNTRTRRSSSEIFCFIVNETGTIIQAIRVTYFGIIVYTPTTTQEYIFIYSDASMIKCFTGSQIVNNGCCQIIARTVKRILEIPLMDAALEICWDSCTSCARFDLNLLTPV